MRALFLALLPIVFGCVSFSKADAPDFEKKFSLYESGPGIAVAVIKNGKVLYKKGFGLRDTKTKESIETDTNFRLASVSKQFVALAVALLEEKNLVSREDNLKKYFPEFGNWSKKIKVKHLIHHLSDLPDYMSLCSDQITAKKVENSDVIEFLAKTKKMEINPGKKYRYSNTGYVVLASLVERVSGKSFSQYMAEHVFEPAKMTHSSVVGLPFPSIRKKALSYSEWPYLDLVDYNSCNFIYGDGGIYSSIDDMIAWTIFLDNNPSLTKKLFKKGKTDSGKEINYGYGWGEDKYKDFKTIEHSGGWVGFRTYIAKIPEKDLWFVMLSNYKGTKGWSTIKMMADFYVKANQP